MFQVNALAGSVPSSGSVPSPLNEITSPARKVLPSCGVRIVAVGGLPTVIVSGVDSVVLVPSETVSRAVYCAGLLRRCGPGWRPSTSAPSPNVQL